MLYCFRIYSQLSEIKSPETLPQATLKGVLPCEQKSKLPKYYKESPEARAERVREEAGRFKSRIVEPKTRYNRQRANNKKNFDY